MSHDFKTLRLPKPAYTPHGGQTHGGRKIPLWSYIYMYTHIQIHINLHYIYIHHIIISRMITYIHTHIHITHMYIYIWIYGRGNEYIYIFIFILHLETCRPWCPWPPPAVRGSACGASRVGCWWAPWPWCWARWRPMPLGFKGKTMGSTGEPLVNHPKMLVWHGFYHEQMRSLLCKKRIQ